MCELSAAAVAFAVWRGPYPENIRAIRLEEHKPLEAVREKRRAEEKQEHKNQMAWLRKHFPRHFQAQLAELTRRGFEVDESTLEVRNRGVQWPPAVRAREEAEARAALYKDGGDPDAELDWAEVEFARILEERRLYKMRERRAEAKRRARMGQEREEEEEDEDDDDEEEDEEEAAGNNMMPSADSKPKLQQPSSSSSGWFPSLRSQPPPAVVQGRGAPAGGRPQQAPDTEDEFSDDVGFGTDSDE